MLARREKGLCYNCDEKFSPGHKCKARFFLLVAEDVDDATHLEPSPSDLAPLLSDADHNASSEAQISFNALAGLPAPKALRLLGLLNKQPITILVDGGSTHNFIQDRVVHFLALPTKPITTLRVMIGNGSEIECSKLCRNVHLLIQGHTFITDLHVLPISGADVVLGIQCLQTLGPVMTNYAKLTMQFIKDGFSVDLKADAPTTPIDISAQS